MVDKLRAMFAGMGPGPIPANMARSIDKSRAALYDEKFRLELLLRGEEKFWTDKVHQHLMKLPLAVSPQTPFFADSRGENLADDLLRMVRYPVVGKY